jgi:polar amino acid transport system substrate-binding protein
MKKILNNLFLLSIIFTFTLVLAGCEKDNTDQYDKIVDRGYIIVGLDDTFAPMGFRDENDKIVGFDVDLAKAVFNQMGLEVKFQRIDWAMKETELNNKKIDLIWNGYTITEDRKEKVTFSDPYLANRQVIVVKADSNIQTKADLANKKVTVQAASSSYDALMGEPAVVDTIYNKAPFELETNNLAFIDLDNGRTDALVVDEILARYYITLNGASNYKVLTEDFGSEQYGVGFRKTDVQLVAKFNEAFNQLKTNGTTTEISEDWFSEDIILK